MKDTILHDKIKTIYSLLRLAKNNNLEYVLEDESAKKLTESMMQYIRTFNISEHNNEDYIKNVKDSLKNL